MILELEPGLKPIEYNPRWETEKDVENFILKMKDDKNKHLYQASTILEGNVTHKNYLEYLLYAWRKHLGVIIDPDIIWHIILSELAKEVGQEKEVYRHLFTTSDEKQKILIQQEGDIWELPLGPLTEALKNLCPTNVDVFLPEFSTSCALSNMAKQAAFAEMCSPYYDYCLYCCGIPSIDVRGTKDDWMLARANFTKLMTEVLPKSDKVKTWGLEVMNVLDNICAYLHDPSLYRAMFEPTKCGSGSELEIGGWITHLFMEMPSLAKVENFSSCVNKVPYTNLSAKMDFVMKSGLLSSEVQENMLIPKWGYIVYNVITN